MSCPLLAHSGLSSQNALELYLHSELLLSCLYPEYGLLGGIKFSGNSTETDPGIKAFLLISSWLHNNNVIFASVDVIERPLAEVVADRSAGSGKYRQLRAVDTGWRYAQWVIKKR